jgi:hypothetical protein
MKKFILLANQRSGTGFLTALLSKHSQIHVYPELLWWLDYQDKSNFFHFWRKKIKKSAISLTPPHQPAILEEFFDFIFDRMKDTKAVGVNIKYDQLAVVPNEINILQKKFDSVVHLIRRNLLKTLISNVLNQNKEVLKRESHSTEKYKACKVNLPMNESLLQDLITLKRNILQSRQIFQKLYSENYLEICYEDFFEENQYESNTISNDILRKIYNLCGVEHHFDIQTDLAKTNPSQLKDLIENFDEIKLFLELNGWGYLFQSKPTMPLSEEGVSSDIDKVIFYLQENQLEHGLNILKNLYANEPNNKRIVFLFINLLYRLKLNPQAEKVFQIYKKQNPTDNNADKIINILRLMVS